MRIISSITPAARAEAEQAELSSLRRQVPVLTRENERQRRRLEFLVRLLVTLRVGVDVGARAQLVDEQHRLGAASLCRVLGVDRKRIYHWRRDNREFTRRAAADESLAALITQIHAESGGAYGAVRVTVALRRRGLVFNRKRVARIMRERGIRGATRRRRRSLTRPDGKAASAPDLVRRRFTASMPGERLAGDITCVPTREGWVYLAVLLDLCTREVVGWATAVRQDAALVTAALAMASRAGRLAEDATVHTDRGAQYTAAANRRELARVGARQSLSRSGSCLDNAPAESFFASLKTEIGRSRPGKWCTADLHGGVKSSRVAGVVPGCEAATG